MPEVRTRKLGN